MFFSRTFSHCPSPLQQQIPILRPGCRNVNHLWSDFDRWLTGVWLAISYIPLHKQQSIFDQRSSCCQIWSAIVCWSNNDSPIKFVPYVMFIDPFVILLKKILCYGFFRWNILKIWARNIVKKTEHTKTRRVIFFIWRKGVWKRFRLSKESCCLVL